LFLRRVFRLQPCPFHRGFDKVCFNSRRDGGNDGQLAPTLNRAILQGSQIILTGRVDGDRPVEIQLFASPAPAAGTVQGQTFIATVGTFAPGPFTAAVPIPASVQVEIGDLLTATATRSGDVPNTSEFSADVVLGS